MAAIFEDLTQIADNTNCDLDLLIFVVKLKTVQHVCDFFSGVWFWIVGW